MALYGDLAYLADLDRGLVAIDVSDPARIQEVATVSDTRGAWGLYVQGEWLYLGCHGAGVRVLSLADPRSPRVVGRFFDGGEAMDVWGDGRYLYVADNDDGVEVLDVEDPAHPREVAQYLRASAHGGIDCDADAAGDDALIYLADGRQGLLILEFQ